MPELAAEFDRGGEAVSGSYACFFRRGVVASVGVCECLSFAIMLPRTSKSWSALLMSSALFPHGRVRVGGWVSGYG